MSGLSKDLKHDLLAAAAEFLGTIMFLTLGLGGIQASILSSPPPSTDQDLPGAQQLLYISCCMGFSLLASAWAFYRVSGSVFNPNVALALLLIGGLKPLRFVLYVIVEVLGAVVAAGILNLILPGPLGGAVGLGAGTKPWQGAAIEALLTCALTMTILFLAVEKHRATPVAPVAIGLVLFVTHLFGVLYTGAALNSARAFGTAVVTGSFQDHWVYWIGPTVGSLLATLFYTLLKLVDYSELNSKQDSCDARDSPSFAGKRIESESDSQYDSKMSPSIRA